LSSNKSQWNDNYNQGKYTLVNPNKYIGNPLDIKFRSSWEYVFCKYLDMNEKILKWGCEQPIITYSDLRGKVHRYYPDFYYEMMVNSDPSNFKRVIIEIKPAAELVPPIRPLNETGKALENYEYAVRTHIKNKLKWNASTEYAAKMGMEYYIITEDRLIKEGLLPPKNYKNPYKKPRRK
jgi:hypothetical protein